jgi:mRNA interferase RelE/StbE
MTNYKVEFVKSAQKELNKLPSQISLRIAKAIYTIGLDPRKGSVRPMVGITSWRLRVGDYRIVHDIVDNRLVILVIRIQHRINVYR